MSYSQILVRLLSAIIDYIKGKDSPKDRIERPLSLTSGDDIDGLHTSKHTPNQARNSKGTFNCFTRGITMKHLLYFLNN